MAHPNIQQRQAHVKRLLESGEVFTAALKKELAARYSCSVSAINADLVTFTKPHSRYSIHTSARVRTMVRNRDGKVCQYCGTEYAREYIVEHIIPAALGGEARPYNLALLATPATPARGAGYGFRATSTRSLRVHPEWRERVLSLIDASSPNVTVLEVEPNGDV